MRFSNPSSSRFRETISTHPVLCSVILLALLAVGWVVLARYQQYKSHRALMRQASLLRVFLEYGDTGEERDLLSLLHPDAIKSNLPEKLDGLSKIEIIRGKTDSGTGKVLIEWSRRGILFQQRGKEGIFVFQREDQIWKLTGFLDQPTEKDLSAVHPPEWLQKIEDVWNKAQSTLSTWPGEGRWITLGVAICLILFGKSLLVELIEIPGALVGILAGVALGTSMGIVGILVGAVAGAMIGAALAHAFGILFIFLFGAFLAGFTGTILGWTEPILLSVVSITGGILSLVFTRWILYALTAFLGVHLASLSLQMHLGILIYVIVGLIGFGVQYFIDERFLEGEI